MNYRSLDRRMRGLLAATLCCWLASSSPVLAHPQLDQAQKLTRELELEPALLAYQRALDSGTLTRDELLTLLVERALLLYGLKRQGELIADLMWLSALQPDFTFDRRAPPDLVATWSALREQTRGALGVQLTAQVTGSLSARAKLTGTVPAGASARISLRESGADWAHKNSDELWQVALPGETLELYAEAVALGGVVVARAYGPDSPLRLKVDGNPAPAPIANASADDSDGWARRNRGWLIGGAVILTSAAAVAGVLWMKSEQDGERRNTTVSPAVQF